MLPGVRTSANTLLKVYQGLDQRAQKGWSLGYVAQQAGIGYQALYQLVRAGPFPEALGSKGRAKRFEYDERSPQVMKCVELGFSVRAIEKLLHRRLPLITGVARIEERTDYYTASLVYEAQDAGFTSKQTSTLLGVSLWRVTRALERREEYEPKIVEGLRVLLDAPSIARPYILGESR
jgi:hypothetical protein